MSVLIILPLKGFNDYDLLNFLEICNDKAFVATYDRELAIGKYGSKVVPDFSFERILRFKSSPFDTLVIIADEGWKSLDIPEVKIITAGFLVPNKKIIAISLAPVLLSKFGFLKGKIATYNYEEFPKYEKILRTNGVKVTNFPVFKDGNIITCKGGDSVFIIKKYI